MVVTIYLIGVIASVVFFFYSLSRRDDKHPAFVVSFAFYLLGFLMNLKVYFYGSYLFMR